MPETRPFPFLSYFTIAATPRTGGTGLAEQEEQVDASDIGDVHTPPAEGEGLGRGRPKLPPIPPRRSDRCEDTANAEAQREEDAVDALRPHPLQESSNTGALHQQAPPLHLYTLAWRGQRSTLGPLLAAKARAT